MIYCKISFSTISLSFENVEYFQANIELEKDYCSQTNTFVHGIINYFTLAEEILFLCFYFCLLRSTNFLEMLKWLSKCLSVKKQKTYVIDFFWILSPTTVFCFWILSTTAFYLNLAFFESFFTTTLRIFRLIKVCFVKVYPSFIYIFVYV